MSSKLYNRLPSIFHVAEAVGGIWRDRTSKVRGGDEQWGKEVTYSLRFASKKHTNTSVHNAKEKNSPII
jgi:hypothetical protein